ncbi:MAG TPA: hypothetical protein VN739_05340 [Nitrososphaerales archaeon]|nr:hypothetical protein [Nitrososphaerales archaeon]
MDSPPSPLAMRLCAAARCAIFLKAGLDLAWLAGVVHALANLALLGHY